MHRMSVKLSFFTVAMGGAIAAFGAGFDGLSLATNDWFDADFTALTADTAIAAGSTTGITLGTGSWTAVPSTGTAKIVADSDNGAATVLSVDAPGEELVFTPAALQSPTGMESVTIRVKADAIDTLPDLGEVQSAFTVYSPDGVDYSLMGYVSDGTRGVWTNLTGVAASSLTNAWFDFTMDFCGQNGSRLVRFSVNSTVLSDSAGTTWFRSAKSNAAALDAISFKGVGDLRLFNGDSLAVIPVAEVNGASYGSLNDAIAAANAGDTVTLVRNTFDNEAIAATKSVTVALGAYNLTAESFSVSSGSTLTFTGTGSVTAPAITGGGSLLFSNNATLHLTGGTSALAAITAAGDLTVAGYGTVNVTGGVEVEGTLAFTPDAATPEIIAAHPYYTIRVAAATVAASALNGAATIETTGGVTASSGTFYGTICGTGGVTATGSFAMQGPSSFSGTLAVSAGTLSLSSYNFNSMVSYDFDASNTGTWEFDETNTDDIKKMKTVIGSRWNFRSDGSEYACLTNDAALFGGKTVMWIPAGAKYRYDTDSSLKDKRAHTILTVYQKPTLSDSGYLHFYNYQNSSTWDGVRLNTTTWSAHNYTASINDYVYVDGVHARTATADKKSVLSVLSPYATNSNRNDNFGGNGSDGFKGAVAEVIGLNTQASIEQSAAITTYLMHKWDLTDKANYAYLPAAADVQMSSGAVIDLGGTAQTVASLSGSGVVSNGTLTVTDPISVAVGSTLVIPYGSTYTCASGTGANIDTTAGTVTFVHNAADIDGVAYDTVQGAILAYESGTLTIHENATDIDLGTAEVNISGIVLDDGVSAPTFSTTLPWQTTYSERSLTHTRVASTFVYVGPAAYAAVASNFEIGEVAASDVPGESDTVQFDTATAITLSSAQEYRYAEIIANAAVTVSVSANKNAYIYADAISGTGKFSLGNRVILSTASAASTISCELEVNSENASVAAQLYVASETRTFTLTGALSGSGYLKCTRTKNGSGYTGCTFHCSDTTRFSGTIEMVRPDDGVGRNVITFWPTCDLSGATVVVGEYSGSHGRFIDGQSNNTVYKFGSLSGYVSPSASSVTDNTHPTIEIGALNKNDTITGNWMPHLSRNPYIRKVGAGTLTTTAANAYGYILNGGTLKVLATDTAPVTTEVSGKRLVHTTETIDADEYTVYTLGDKIGSVLLYF